MKLKIKKVAVKITRWAGRLILKALGACLLTVGGLVGLVVWILVVVSGPVAGLAVGTAVFFILSFINFPVWLEWIFVVITGLTVWRAIDPYVENFTEWMMDQ